MSTRMRSRALALMAFSLTAGLLVAGVAGAQSSDPTPADDWLVVDYDVDVAGNLSQLTLDGVVEIHEVERPELDGRRANQAVQDQCGESCTADDLRQLYQDFPSRQDELVQEIESQIEAETAATLRQVGGDDPTTDATANRSALEQEPGGSPYQAPIDVDVEGRSTIGLVADADLTDEQVDAVFRMGARAETPVTPTVDPGTNLTLSLTVAEPLAILDTETADLDGRTARWAETNWKATTNATIDDTLRVGDPDVVVPDGEEVDVDVTMDLSEIDPHYWGALTGGNAASLSTELTVDGQVHAVETPPDAQRESLELPYLSADALRIGVDAGLVDESRLTQFEDQARASIKDAYRSLLGEEVRVSGGIQPDTLGSASVGSPPGTGGPIVLDMGAAADVPVPPEGGSFGASAFEVTRIDQGTVELPEIPTPGDRPANVSIVLPEGVDLVYDSVEGGNATTWTNDEGKTVVSFRSGGGQGATIQNAQIVVNSPLIWNLFWPVLLFLFLVLVVLPAIVIFLVLRRRREDDEGGGPGRTGSQAAGPSAGGSSGDGSSSDGPPGG